QAAQVVDLPTYAFQRERYWLEPGRGVGDLAAAGLGVVEHPLLRTGQRLAGADEWLFTGSVSTATHPWVADHVVLDTIVLPATAFVDIALTAGDTVGCETLQELTFEAPLVLGGDEAMQLQVRVEGPDRDGRRAIAIYSRREISPRDDDDRRWTRHASGAVAPGIEAERSELIERLAAEAWPPEGADELDVDGVYDRLAQLGFAYGPSFMGVRAAWCRADELFADVSLDARHVDEAGRYGVHPALLDSAMHVVVKLVPDSEDGTGRMLFHWEGVRRYGGHGTSMRVRLGMVGDETWNVAALDESGAGILSVEAVVARRVAPEQLAMARRGGDTGLGLTWVEVPVSSANGNRPSFALLSDVEPAGPGKRYPGLRALDDAIDAGAQPPDVVLATTHHSRDGSAGSAVRAAACRTLELLQAWLADERLPDSRLVFVSREGVAVDGDDIPDLGTAAVWGLVRSAQSEHPGRFGLLDTDRDDASWHAASVLLSAGESQLALRAGVARVPRVARVTRGPAGGPAFDPDGTVLITGGTSGLGALLARHLVSEHGVRRLLLASRRGPRAPAAGELEADLVRLGASPVLAACDVAEREQLSDLIASIAPEHPLTAVIHAAGVLDDSVIEALTPEQVDRVLRPKVDGALHLHELTAGRELTHFLMFSSFAATIGSPAQGNYSAANACIDALAQRRHAAGLPAKSLVWGPWSEAGGMTGDRNAAETARIARLGAQPMSDEEGLALFDAVLDLDDPLPLLARLDTAALLVRARDGALPAILGGLVSARRPRAGEAADSLQRRLSALPEPAWAEIVLDTVRDQIASVLGLGSRESVDPQRAFKDMGFDSLAAVELRGGLTRATRIALPATLIYDYPTPTAVAEHVLGKLAGAGAGRPTIESEFDRIERLLQGLVTDERTRRQVDVRLRAFNTRVQTLLAHAENGHRADDEDLDSVSDEEMFKLIDKEFGVA
ncbi:MAG: hypothetical protein QOH12_3543, partial [Solirubrobacteraceae bacterium]|nr:hypothetical protein [Solirubrobacteraceae bacterium]